MIGCDLIRDLEMYKIPDDYFYELDKKCGIVKIDPDDLNNDKLKDIEIYFGDRISLPLIDRMPKLKWVHFTSIGYDRIIGTNRKDLIVTNSSGTMNDGVVSTTLGFMFSLSRGFNYCLKSNNIDRTEFDKYFNTIQDVIGQSCLIVGMGNIGKKLANICKSFDMVVKGIRTTSDENNFTLEQMPEIISDFDFVINILPHSKQTDSIFDKSMFSKMKKSSFFINVGRGKTVVEKDLIQALKSKTIAGAGLDVFESEPLSKNSELRRLQNVIVTPHIAGYTKKYWKLQKKLFSENLDRYLSIQPLLNKVGYDKK
tara:strand:+ start:1500 stop:2435 length:936 start_codon:yes stop_codon:yes gene_type:complete